MSQQAYLQGLIGMNGDRQPDVDAWFAVDVMATVDSQQLPAMLFHAMA